KQAKGLEWLFGRESIKAIAPLLNNTDLLRANFRKVADAQQYAGSMQKEYDSRAKTTENHLVLMKNGFNAVAITIGNVLLPEVDKAVMALIPYIKQAEEFIKQNPDLVRSAVKFAASLVGIGIAVAGISRAFRILNAVINLSPAKLAITALAAGAMLIINNWDQVGPVIKQVWVEVDRVAQAMGGWQTVIEGVGIVMAGSFAIKTIGSLQQAVTLAGSLSALLGKIGRLGAMTITIGIAISLLKQLQDLEKQASSEGVSKGEFLVNRMQSQERERGYNGFIPRLREILGMDNPIPDGRYTPQVGLEKPISASRQQSGELKVSFDNAPPGMRVAAPAGSATPWLSYDVGYSRFSNKN
ncbi:phage tail tape measure protein, partial [Cronobacter sakazakii]|nr:phage tail tape measure protein [Cronobacter sakazakii]